MVRKQEVYQFMNLTFPSSRKVAASLVKRQIISMQTQCRLWIISYRGDGFGYFLSSTLTWDD